MQPLARYDSVPRQPASFHNLRLHTGLWKLCQLPLWMALNSNLRQDEAIAFLTNNEINHTTRYICNPAFFVRWWTWTVARACVWHFAKYDFRLGECAFDLDLDGFRFPPANAPKRSPMHFDRRPSEWRKQILLLCLVHTLFMHSFGHDDLRLQQGARFRKLLKFQAFRIL